VGFVVQCTEEATDMRRKNAVATPQAPLAGQTALVTGAGRRIGRAIALELARAGADVVVHVNRSLAEGQAVAEAIGAMGRRAAVVQADQRDVAAIAEACRQAEAALGPVSLLVNNAAIWPRVRLDRCSQEDFDQAIEVNLRGPFFWARYLGPAMKRRGRGSIVFIADAGVDRPHADSLPYDMAKAALTALTRGLAKALAPEARVNAVAPGPIMFPKDYPEASKRHDRATTLLGREGTPEDVARAVRFLLESPYVTGAVLPVDGGFRLGIRA
jgi:pteridine reductase